MSRSGRLALAALLLVVPARAHAQADEGAASQSIPSPDLPPQSTKSGKVHASRDAGRPPALGPEDAPVRIVLFSDFQCPVCARMTKATYQITEEWPGDVRLEFRSFAPPIHRHAENAAIAALAAHRQGKFWPMHDALFADQGALDPDGLRRAARAAGLDLKRWEKDIADPTLRTRVQRETEEGKRLGVTGTPSYLVNGKLTVGWGSWAVLRHQVDDEQKAAAALVAQKTKRRDVARLRARANARDDAAFVAYEDVVLGPAARAR